MNTLKIAFDTSDGLDFELLRRRMLLRVTAVLVFIFAGIYASFWAYLELDVLTYFFLFTCAFATVIFFNQRLGIPHFVAAHSLVFVSALCITLAGIYTWLQTPIATGYFPLVMVASTFLVLSRHVALIWLVIDVTLMLLIHPVATHFGFYSLPTEWVPYFNLINACVLLLAIVFLIFIFQSISQRVIENLITVKGNLESVQKNLIDVQQYRNRFFSSISHEIRTPMNAVRGISELLSKNDDFMREEGNLVNALKTSATHLLSLVNDLLDVSKLEVGQFKLTQADFDLHQCIQEADTIVRYEAISKNLKYELQLHPEVPKYVYGDVNRLRQVIVNLLSNAVKFTSHGSIVLSCWVTQDADKKQPLLRIDVADTGIGIEPSVQNKIFEAFIQGDESISQTYGGTGLGLNISQKIVELQGGRIWFDSQLGVGSTFHVELPLVLSKNAEVVKTVLNKSPSLTSEVSDCTIMLVEDNKINVLVAIRLISMHLPNVKIIEAENGAKALELLNAGTIPDLILMDLQMPVMGGRAATRAIREHDNPRIASLPIIAMTADAAPEDMERCFEVGMNDFLSKPIDTKLLHKKLDAFLINKEKKSI